METSTSFRFLFFTCISLQAMIFWSCGRSQQPGYLSIDCGSNAAYIDDDGIEWISDTINEGTPTPVNGMINDHVLSTMRLFDGNQTKYCYNLSTGAVEAGAFFLVRASIWPGTSAPYTPKDKANFRFKMIVDANEWIDVVVPFETTDWRSYDMYTRAQRSSIEVCLARITPDGDAPFISALEIRPLPSTMSATTSMNDNNAIFINQDLHYDLGVPASGPYYTRYFLDPLDRYWVSFGALEWGAALQITTDSDIDVTNHQDQPPIRILQNAFIGAPYIHWNYTNLDPNSSYFVEFYFAEIDPAVNASGQRAFDILANGVPINAEGAIDVFAQVGANSAFVYRGLLSPDATGGLAFNFTPTATSIFPPFVAAFEMFETKSVTLLSSVSAVSAVDDIKAGLGLSSYRGDPCLPVGYGYSWLNCSTDQAAPEITALVLSNFGTGGEIPGAINSLTTLTHVYLDGNSLQGEIPDLSALANLETLVLSNNRLHGSIPNFLAALKNLTVLYLQNNNLSGEIPAALLQRKQASSLKFEFSGNPLCEINSTGCSSSPSSAPVPNAPTPKKSSIGIIIGVVVAVILLVSIVIIGIAVYCFCTKKPPTSKKNIGHPDSSPQQELPRLYESPSPVISKVMPKLSVQEFSFQEIKDATSNFSTQLGQGGFGPVFKGCLQDGRFVAIKVASSLSYQGIREFLNEVDLLSRVHHKNLVRLLGYCNEEKLVLVYEFMLNGSLFDCLHGPYSKVSPLPWGTRLRILVDAAQGIDYLHNGCNPRIIHRDVKCSNILLNDEMEAKISDFGISRDYIKSETGAAPTTLMGSIGYMDPEYLATMRLSEKVDVYSFGVLLFEVVCGRTAVFKDSSQRQISLLEWAKGPINRGVIDDIVDVSLHGQYDVSSVWQVVEVALACVEMPSFKRPKMSDVYLELREAKRMELGSDERNVIDKPSVEFTGGNNSSTLPSYTHVRAR